MRTNSKNLDIKSAGDAAATAAESEGAEQKAIDKARRTAEKAEAARAKQKRSAAAAAVVHPDPTSIHTELKASYEDWYAEEFEKTMQAVLHQYGKHWQDKIQADISKTLEARQKKLTARPAQKKGQPPVPPPAQEDIAADIEAVYQQKYCRWDVWQQNELKRFMYAWMVGRREQIDFPPFAPGKGKPMARGFKALRSVPASERMDIPFDLKGDKKPEKIAPETFVFLRLLQQIDPHFKASNYFTHGSGTFLEAIGDKSRPVYHTMGFSVDLSLEGRNSGTDERGFWEHQRAVEFLLNIDKAAKGMSAEWRVLYNDARVAQEVNRKLGTERIAFTGGLDKQGRLNWHGPAPLKIHFHLDIAIPDSARIEIYALWEKWKGESSSK